MGDRFPRHVYASSDISERNNRKCRILIRKLNAYSLENWSLSTEQFNDGSQIP